MDQATKNAEQRKRVTFLTAPLSSDDMAAYKEAHGGTHATDADIRAYRFSASAAWNEVAPLRDAEIAAYAAAHEGAHGTDAEIRAFRLAQWDAEPVTDEDREDHAKSWRLAQYDARDVNLRA